MKHSNIYTHHPISIRQVVIGDLKIKEILEINLDGVSLFLVIFQEKQKFLEILLSTQFSSTCDLALAWKSSTFATDAFGKLNELHEFQCLECQFSHQSNETSKNSCTPSHQPNYQLRIMPPVVKLAVRMKRAKKLHLSFQVRSSLKSESFFILNWRTNFPQSTMKNLSNKSSLQWLHFNCFFQELQFPESADSVKIFKFLTAFGFSNSERFEEIPD
jgi:hypothetical protein